MVGRLLAAVAGLCGRRAGVAGTGTGRLFSASLPWKQRQAELQAAFPQGEDLLVLIIDGAIPEVADVTSGALAEALAVVCILKFKINNQSPSISDRALQS